MMKSLKYVTVMKKTIGEPLYVFVFTKRNCEGYE